MMHHHPKRNSKEKNQRYHAKVRMLQHYGIQITNWDLDRMAEIYRFNPDVAILHRRSNRVVKAVIPYKGEVYPIVYDNKRHQIVTILKEEYLSPEHHKILEACRWRLKQSLEEKKDEQVPVESPLEIDDDEEIVFQEDATEEDILEEPDVTQESEEDENQRLMREAFERLPNF